MEVIQNNSKYYGGGGGHYVSSRRYIICTTNNTNCAFLGLAGALHMQTGPILPRSYNLTHINILVTYM